MGTFVNFATFWQKWILPREKMIFFFFEKKLDDIARECCFSFVDEITPIIQRTLTSTENHLKHVSYKNQYKTHSSVCAMVLSTIITCRFTIK